jgi:hypothetical protein
MCDYDYYTDYCDDYEDQLEDYIEDEAIEDEVDEAEAREDLEWSMYWAMVAKLPTERPYPMEPSPSILKWRRIIQRARTLFDSGALDSGSSHEDIVSCMVRRGLVKLDDQFGLLRVLQDNSWTLKGGFG